MKTNSADILSSFLSPSSKSTQPRCAVKTTREFSISEIAFEISGNEELQKQTRKVYVKRLNDLRIVGEIGITGKSFPRSLRLTSLTVEFINSQCSLENESGN